MDKTTQILSALFGVAIVLMIAPSVFRLNQGKNLKNIALWVAIFFGLAIAYKTVGPGKNALPLMTNEQIAPTINGAESNAAGDEADQTDKTSTPTLKEEDGFSPPRE
ncbi:MAG: hypothetical protein WC612_06075 [Bdellovibrionales bacterium]|jgi:hypothetical protein